MDEKFDLNQIVKNMREQRPYMIQTPVWHLILDNTIKCIKSNID